MVAASQILDTSLTTRYAIDDNVSYLLEELFLEKWIVRTDYERYFEQCASHVCTYSYAKRADAVHMVTVLLGLYGGLQTALRTFIPLVVKMVLKRRRGASLTNTLTIQTVNISTPGNR